MFSDGFNFAAGIDIFQILGEIYFRIIFMLDRALRYLSQIIFFYSIQAANFIIASDAF